MIKCARIDALLRGRLRLNDSTEGDVLPVTRQMGVDMGFGLDITSLCCKRQVGQIVLFMGDADFVPAAKLAPRERIRFGIDSMWWSTSLQLREHIDGLRSSCRRPGLR